MALFFGGVPTGPDVDLLMDRFPVGPDVSVSYFDIVETIGVTPSAPRFRTITTAWRNRVFRQRGLQSKCQGGTFTFLTADEAHDRAYSGVEKIGRSIGRQRTKIEAIPQDQLTTEQRRVEHVLLRREINALYQSAQSAAIAIAAPTPAKRSLPLPEVVTE